MGYCSLHSRLYPVRYHHVHLYLERNVSDQNTGTPHLHGFIVPETRHLIYNCPCPQRESQQVKENIRPTYSQRLKPAPGILVLARLAFLDSKVTRCYGCGNSLKPEGTNPHLPDDLVLTTRLHRQYYKDGRQHTSPGISSVYYHVSPYCIRATFPSFQANLCEMPSDLQPFLLPEHKQLIFEKLAVMV